MTDAYEDLFGSDPSDAIRERRKRRLAARQQHQPVVPLSAAAAGGGFDDLEDGVRTLLRPVTKKMLATVFRMDPQTVSKRLARCPSIKEGNRDLYDFPEAASYIVKPQMTPQEFIRTLNTADLPPQINKFFWDSQRARIRFKLEAQESWDTEDVLAVLSDVFMTFKDVMQMATEEVRERARLTDEQAAMFETFIDDLRQTLREKLVDMPRRKRTPSLLDQPLFGTSKDVDVDGDVDVGGDDDEGDGEE